MSTTQATRPDMRADQSPVPGPWKVEANGRWFYVYRLSHWNTGWREYLTAQNGVSSRPSRFKTEANARAAIARATEA